MTENMRALVERAAALDVDGAVSRRREELVQRAQAAGHSHEYADRLYDVASEEGVDPAAAFELVFSGIGVRELIPPSADQWEETQVEAPPTWVAESEAPEDAAQERLVRTTFRRLRSIMEGKTSAREAIAEFVEAPDVGEVNYSVS